MNGDIIANINLERMIEHHESSGHRFHRFKLHNIKVPFGVLKVMDGRVTGVKEKPDMEVLVNVASICLSRRL